jgi:hypothetical protein
VQIWGVAMVRDEADIIELTVRHMLGQGLDRLLIADNLSRDGTRMILDGLADALPITVLDDRDPAYRQSEKMTALANQAAKLGADWIVPFDADELWRASGCSVRDAIMATGAAALAAPVYDHHPRPTARRGSVVEQMPWNRASGWAKVAFRWAPGAVITMGNHSVDGVAEPQWGSLLIDHYPYRSYGQYRRKVRQGQAGLQLAQIGRNEGPLHWHRLGVLPEWRLRLQWWALRLHPKLRRRDRVAVVNAPEIPDARRLPTGGTQADMKSRLRCRAGSIYLGVSRLGLRGALVYWMRRRVIGPARGSRQFTLRARDAKHPLRCRAGSSDLYVFRQIFVEREYGCLDNIDDARLVVDCGANVGYSAA